PAHQRGVQGHAGRGGPSVQPADPRGQPGEVRGDQQRGQAHPYPPIHAGMVEAGSASRGAGTGQSTGGSSMPSSTTTPAVARSVATSAAAGFSASIALA